MTKPKPAAARGRCIRCRKSGYTVRPAFDGRPEFKCQGCDFTWTCGRDGREYLAGAIRESAQEGPKTDE